MSIFKDERMIPRAGMTGKIRYSRRLQTEEYPAHIINSSMGGLGMISQYPYLKGTELFLRSEANDNLTQRVRVAWSKPARRFKKSHPRYNVGVIFQN